MQRGGQTVRRDEEGFSLVEILVVIGIFSTVSIAIYQMMFSGSAGSQTARSVAELSSEARLGLNRMIRDTRQAANITSAGPTSYTIEVDFDGSGSIAQAPARNSDQDYEQVSFVYGDGAIYIEACSSVQGADCGAQKTVLIEGVSQVPGKPVFEFSTNHLEFDWNNDGRATQGELNVAGSHGLNLTAAEATGYLSDVAYIMRLTDGDSTSDFYGHAQLRNKR